MLFWIAIAMTVIANVAYNLCSKMTAPVHPLAALTATYAVSLAACLALYPLFSKNPHLVAELRQANWASLVLGLAIVLLESGFILAFRSGWNLGYAALFSNAAAALVLAPISVLAFKDRISAPHVLGMAVTAAGLWLMLA